MLTDAERNSFDAIEQAIKSNHLPSFPVTAVRKITLEPFTDLWIKDESTQETGTHKDRMAWEIVMAYYSILKAKKENIHQDILPQFSIISAGSAALAIQTQLNKYHLPHLKILVDEHTNDTTLATLRSIGCEVYKTKLEDRILTSQDILTLTENTTGFDITSNKALDPDIRFYDWMAYEILNENPEYVLVPYGTGQLYENILNIAKLILTSEKHDDIYTGDKNTISQCHFIGATTNDPNTTAVKLYAPFRPFTQSSPEWVRLFIQQGYCGDQSRIVEVSEEYIQKGHQIMHDLGIPSEPSGASALGLLLQIKNEIPKSKKIIVINTGCAKI